ncbi:hypothetical protein [Pseudomonas viridiflava]|uniref:hypothetical protein n=1 Tax=Pseudomonas viridiflava TaxID=33069 RepID=UPI0013CE71A4|nr:hypothetical protein [Pseudomonas viridiflava]
MCVTLSAHQARLIVTTLLRGNASQDAPRPLSNVAQSIVGGMPKRSMGTIRVEAAF